MSQIYQGARFKAYCPKRQGSDSLKFDGMEAEFGRSDLLAFWVADMDFLPPSFIPKLIAQKSREVLGYPHLSPSVKESVAGWFQRRFGVEVESEAVIPTSGVVTSMYVAIEEFTQKGDKIVLQSPVYGPFFSIIQGSGRQILDNPLRLSESGYGMDLEHLENLFLKEHPKMLLFCSPQNPTGRVWRHEELRDLVRLCARYEVLLVSDEIHFDLVYERHTPLLAIEEARERTILISAPTKSFNVPGLNISYAVIPSKLLRERFEKRARIVHIARPNAIGLTVMEALYQEGEEWLLGLLEYLKANRSLLEGFIATHPKLKGVVPQGTYLYWIDFGGLNLNHEELKALFLEARLALSPGKFFTHGRETSHFRFNFGTSRARVREGLKCLGKIL